MDSLLGLFKRGATDFKSRLGDVRAAAELARRRREELLVRPLPAADIVALLSEILDRRADAFRENLQRRLSHYVRNSPKLDPSKAGNAALMMDGAVAATGPYLEQLFATFFKDAVMQKLVPMVEQMVSDNANNPSRAERSVELKRLDEELARLEAIEREMLDELEKIRAEAQL